MAKSENPPNTDLSICSEDGDKTISPKLSIAIHSLIESSQSQHGLRHTDYAQYRSYCTRRLSRLRHSKPFRTELYKITKIYESNIGTNVSKATKGARHAFKPAPYYRDESLSLEVAKTNENFMLVELISAERAWCHASELKVEYDDIKAGVIKTNENKKKEGSRSHFMNRLKKAVQFANRLQEMALAAADERTIMESKAYAAWMRGNLCLERSDYKSAYVNYGTALAFCRELAQGFSNTKGGGNGGDDVTTLEMKDYFTARAENVIAPMLHFCQYELRDSGMSETDIVAMMKDLKIDSNKDEREGSSMETTGTTSSTSSIHFRNQTVPISNHALLVALLKLETLVSTYNKNKNIKIKDSKKSKKQDLSFVDLLSGYDDANAIVSKEYKEMKGMKSGPAVDAKKRELENITGYLSHKKLKLMMERNEQLVDELRSSEQKDEKLEEIAHLYDALIQDARTVACLPGGPVTFNDNAVAAPVEDDFVLEANAHVLRFRALRCYYLGRMYGNKQMHKKAIGLFDHALEISSEAAEELSACVTDRDAGTNALVESMVALEKDISGAKCRAQACAYLALVKRHSSSSPVVKRSLLNRLDDFDGGNKSGGVEKYHLADVPPTLQYIPCKPAFFDIALNHIGELPKKEFEKIIEEHTSSKSSSLLGWFRRS